MLSRAGGFLFLAPEPFSRRPHSGLPVVKFSLSGWETCAAERAGDLPPILKSLPCNSPPSTVHRQPSIVHSAVCHLWSETKSSRLGREPDCF
jgi:hypothetical protein